jgi:outer membrane protein assembly factor BamB
LWAAAGAAQEPPDRLKKVILPGEVRQVTSRLAAVADLVRRASWTEALDEYHRLINEAGDNLVPLEPDGLHAGQRSIQIRRLCHLRIAALPPPALRLYRDRVDVQAEKWLRQGIEDRDVQALRRVVDEAFCSRAGAQALDLLGDLAFERGDFEEAQGWWRLLAPPSSAPAEPRADQLRYPGPVGDPGQIRAKQILARLFQGEVEQAAAELQVFRRLHPQAAGHLAGRKGNYAATLHDLIEQARGAPPTAEAQDWPTFGGAASRNRSLPNAPHHRLWADGPTWRVRLDSGELLKTAGAEETQAPGDARRVGCYPVIVGAKVFVAHARQVLGFDLLTGRPLGRYELKAAAPIGKQSSEPDGPHTLTAADDRVYARLGGQLPGSGKDRAKAVSPNFLVCLEHEPKGAAAQSFRERWRIPAHSAPGTPTAFEGAPLVQGQRVYAAVTSLAGSRTQTAIACYDADSGALRWRQEVCDCPQYETLDPPRSRCHLLTLAGCRVVYCSDTGAIVALDAWTGKRTWAMRYPSRGPRTADGDPSPRGLAPCLATGGRLFAAPADTDRVFCLDPDTGRILWERDRLEVVHLLGVARQRLIFTTPGGIRALNADTGGDQGGWSEPAEGKLPGLGRGLLVGGWVFWPTQDPKLPLRAVSQEDGCQERGQDTFDPTQLRSIRPGNMALGGGCLVVAGANELVGYVSPERFLQERQRDAARPDASGRTFYRLAQAEAGAGLCVPAMQHFARAEQIGEAGQGHGLSLRLLVRSGRERLLADLLRGEGRGRDPAQGSAMATLLSQLTENQNPVAWGLSALITLGDLWQRAGRPKEALGVWQTILNDKSLRQVRVVGAGGLPQRAGDLAAIRIEALNRSPGPRLSKQVEQRVQHLEPKDHRIGAETAPVSRPTRDQSFPLERAWEIPAGRLIIPARSAPVQSMAADLFFVRGTELSCHDATTGALRWRHLLPLEPTWIGCHADMVLVAGPQGVLCRHVADGKPAWEFVIPSRTAPQDDSPTEEALSGFQLTTAYLFCFCGERRLFALDVNTGEVAWGFWAPGAKVRPLADGGRFQPHYLADTGRVILQTTGGTRLMLASGTGHKVHEAPTAIGPWRQPPLALDERRVCLVEDAHHVHLLDLATGKEIWTYQPRAPTSLTSEPPRLFGNREALFILVPLNYGYQLERIDPATGKHLWPATPRISRTALDGKNAACDVKAVYYAAGNVLYARSLSDGKRLWQRPLPSPAGPWQVVRLGSTVAVYPLPDVAAAWQIWGRQPCWVPVGCLGLRLPLPRSLETPLNRAHAFPLLFHSAKDGHLVQRLDFATVYPWAVVQFFRHRLVVAGDGRGWCVRPGR